MSVDAAVRDEIADLNAGFAWALDLHEYERLRGILAPDVHYVSVGREFHDAEAVIASFRARKGLRTTRHGLGNILLTEREDGTLSGLSSWHTFAANGDSVRGVPLFMVADFHDVYSRDDSGHWRIAERLIEPVFRDADLAPHEPSTSPPGAPS